MVFFARMHFGLSVNIRVAQSAAPGEKSTAQLVTSRVLADHSVYLEELLKCSSKDNGKARGRE